MEPRINRLKQADSIKATRLALGLSRSLLARMLGWNGGTLKAIEDGRIALTSKRKSQFLSKLGQHLSEANTAYSDLLISMEQASGKTDAPPPSQPDSAVKPA